MQPTLKNGGLSDPTPVRFSALFDRFFNDALTNFSKTGVVNAANFTPHVDVLEDDKKYELHFAVPGMEKEHFKLELNENTLIVSGERKFESEEKNKTFHRVETQFGSFARAFTLPNNVKRDAIEAEYKNGMLQVVLPKDENTPQDRRISVK